MVQEKAFNDDTLRDQIEWVDHDWAAAHKRIDDESAELAEHADYCCTGLAADSVDRERHAVLTNCCSYSVDSFIVIDNRKIPPMACSSEISSGRRTRFIVFKPRDLPIAMIDRPTPEL